jgi:two-component system chemotaxis response regulator CheY
MPEKILIVDDSPLIHKMYSVMIKGLHFDAVNAMNGQEALDVLQWHQDIRLVLLDLNMPVMNGLQFLEKAEELGIIRKIPVIIVSSEDREEVCKGLQLGARGFLRKSFNHLEFSDLIGRHLPRVPAN